MARHPHAAAPARSLLADLRARAALTYTMLTLTATSVEALLNDLLLVDELAAFWQVYVTTAPLTLGFAVLTWAWLRGGVEVGHLVGVGALLALGNALGYATGMPGLAEAAGGGQGLGGSLARLLVGYVLAYPDGVFAAAAVGVLLGWSWHRVALALRPAR